MKTLITLITAISLCACQPIIDDKTEETVEENIDNELIATAQK